MKKNFLTSERVAKALSKMKAKSCTLEELELKEEEIDELVSAMGNINYNKSDKTYYISMFNENNYEIISFLNKEKVTEKWLEISDIYFGSKFYDKDTLVCALNTARERGITNVHIAGDLCAGHPSFKKQEMYLTAKTAQEQADIAIKLFSKYPEFKYYCINGERDLSFEKGNSINPIVLVQRKLNEKGIEFHHINEMIANLVIDGVVKIIQHGEGKQAYTKSYKPEQIVWQRFENSGDNVVIKGRNYNLCFIQFGHYHTSFYERLGGVNMTSTAGMIYDTTGVLKENTSYPNFKIIETVIKKGKVLEFNIENDWSPKRVIM